MSIEKVHGYTPCASSALDPRVRILKEHYFSLRAAPLEEWLWDHGVSPSAERVFWLHWREGQRRGDFCSEIPLSVVARRCRLNVSSVTRAYQALERLDCLKRTNPGRNPANPFCQATSVTEVFIPKALLASLSRQPSRSRKSQAKSMIAASDSAATAGRSPSPPTAIQPGPVPPNSADPAFATGSPAQPSLHLTPNPAPRTAEPADTRDPLTGLSGRQRVAVMASWRQVMSAPERQRYDAAFREIHPAMDFDVDSRVTGEHRSQILQLLAFLASRSRSNASAPASPRTAQRLPSRPRTLFTSEAAALRNKLVQLRGTTASAELMRQITWSIERGALATYPVPKAIAIALKKIREEAWTRPHRMPPNWWPMAARPELCSHA